MEKNRNKLLSKFKIVLKKIYLSLFKRREMKLVGRNWNLEFELPMDTEKDFYKTILIGDLNYPVTNNFTNILLCAQPKSASLYITQLLAQSFNFDNYQIGINNKGGTLYYPRLLAAKYSKHNTISHCHEDASQNLISMVVSKQFKVIVLTRNLLDALVSRRDMLIRDKHAPNFLSLEGMSKFLAGSDEYQLDVVIELFASQYINFFTSWKQKPIQDAVNPVFGKFEELVTDEIGFVQRIANELNIEVAKSKIELISSKIRNAGGINFSTGTMGRGKKMMTESHIKTIRKKADVFNCTDEVFLGFSLKN